MNWTPLNRDLVVSQLFNVAVSDAATVGNANHLGVIGTDDRAQKTWQPVEGLSWEFVPVVPDAKRSGFHYYLRGDRITRRQFPGNAYTDYFVGPCGWGFALDARAATNLAFVHRRQTTTTTSQMLRATDGQVANPTWTLHPVAAGLVLGSDDVVAIRIPASAPTTAYAMTSSGRCLYCRHRCACALGVTWHLGRDGRRRIGHGLRF